MPLLWHRSPNTQRVSGHVFHNLYIEDQLVLRSCYCNEERNNKKKATYLPRGSTGKYSGNFDGPSRVGVPDTASRILFQTMMLMLGDR